MARRTTKTRYGRVVYDRKKHTFKPKDALRVARNVIESTQNNQLEKNKFAAALLRLAMENYVGAGVVFPIRWPYFEANSRLYLDIGLSPDDLYTEFAYVMQENIVTAGFLPLNDYRKPEESYIYGSTE